MTKFKMAVAGVCLAMCAAAAEKELSYRVQVDGTDVPLDLTLTAPEGT